MHKINHKNIYGAKSLLLLVLFLLPFSPPALRAQNVGNWNFNSILTGVPGSFNTITIADFSPAVPIHAFNGGTEYFGEGVWPAGAINTNMYLEFAMVPLPGYQLDINSIILRIRRSNTGTPAGAGPTSWALRSSNDLFTNDIASGSMTLNYADYTVNLPGSFLSQYLPVVFRLYGYHSTVNPGGNSRLVVDNITAKGLGYLLPVKLGALNGAITNNKPVISFSLYTTEKNNRYLLERSFDALNFTTVTTLIETDNAAEKKYVYTDNSAVSNDAPEWYYRLHIVNTLGAHSYSNTIVLKTKNSMLPLKTSIRNNQLLLAGNFSETAKYYADVSTVGGQVVSRKMLNIVKGYNSIALPLNASVNNSCVVHVYNSNGYSSSAVVIHQ